MLRSLRYKLVIIVATLTMSVPVLIPIQAAACTNIGSGIAQGINATQGPNSAPLTCGVSGSLTGGVQSLAVKVVNIFSLVVGIISVIMIIYAGFRYITSGGESGSVSSAKNTLIYAIIGLVIVVLAQIIVHFVLNTTSNAIPTTGL